MEKKEMVIDVFGQKIVVSQQAKVAFWGYVIILLAMIGMALVGKTGTSMGATGIAIGILSLVFLVAYMLVGLYILNCTVTGNCNVMAWIITALVLFSAAVYVTIFIASFGLVKAKK